MCTMCTCALDFDVQYVHMWFWCAQKKKLCTECRLESPGKKYIKILKKNKKNIIMLGLIFSLN